MHLATQTTTTAPDTTRVYGPVSALILGSTPGHRGTVMVSMYAAIVYLAGIGLLAYGVRAGFIEPGVAPWMISGLVLTILVIYAMLRSGWSRRLKDPTLTLFQMVIAISWDCVTYAALGAALGDARIGMLMFIELTLFFGIFSLNARAARIIQIYTLVAAGSVMLFMSLRHPERFPADLEFVYFVALVLVTNIIARLASQLAGMRCELETQREGLTSALSHIQEASTRDPLTGLHNRRHMMDMLNHELDRHQRFKTGFTLALVDLDHFKQVNDRYGHQTGDEALCCFARQARAALRAGDVLARWGGEEFLVLYPESPPQDALDNLSLLRNSLVGAVVSAEHSELRVRFSAGLTSYVAGEPIDRTIERADQALYQAKAAGRNRCELLLGSAH